MGEINERLSVDFSGITAEINQAAGQAAAAEVRVRQLATRINATKNDIALTEALAARVSRKISTQLAKFATLQLAGSLLSEIDMPEAARPITNIGFSAFQGFQVGGPIGAGIFAVGALAREALSASKRVEADVARMREKLIKLEKEQKESLVRIEEESRRREELAEKIDLETEIQIEERARDLDYDAWQLTRLSR